MKNGKIECTDFMVGDLVMDDTNDCVKLDGIGCSDFNEIKRKNGYPITVPDRDDRYVGVEKQKKFYNVYLGDIRPIPISMEFLEKNSFVKTELNDGCLYILKTDQIDKEIHLTSCSIDDGSGVALWYLDINGWLRIPIKYIHELQHGMRFIGLEEIANSFEV